MKISSITVRPLQLPITEPIKIPWGDIVSLMGVLVIAKSNEGTKGYGTTATVPPYAGMTEESLLSVIKYIAPSLEGVDPFDLEEISYRMDRRITGNYPAKNAIDMAVYDLLGKIVGVPTVKLIGGRMRESFITDRALFEKSLKEMAKDAIRAVKEDGFKAFELHIGSTPERDVQTVKTIREAVGDKIIIVADAHKHWNVKSAITTLRKLEDFNIIVEQPTETIDQLAEVRKNVGVQICADESCHTIADAQRIVDKKAADIITVKIIKAGGIWNARKIVNIAEAAGLSCRVDGVPGDTKLSNTASAHLALSIKTLVPGSGVMQHYYSLKKDITAVGGGGLIFRDGEVSVPDKPGFGVNLKE